VYPAIAALPPDFRDAVAAIDLVGHSYREAAVELHVREATITTRLHRGRQRVARALSDSFPGPFDNLLRLIVLSCDVDR